MAYKQGDYLINVSVRFRFFSSLLYKLVIVPTRIVCAVYYGLRVKGKENLPKSGSCFFVSNHALALDPLAIDLALRPVRSYYTLLEETCMAPFHGTLVRLLGGIPVPRRKEGFLRLEDELLRALLHRDHVHFFPEGECYLWNQEIRDFKTGAFYFSMKLGVPIIPVVTVLKERTLFGKNHIVLFGRKIMIPPRVVVVISRPYSPEEFGRCVGAGTEEVDRTQVKRFADTVRSDMQRIIDGEGGVKTICRGQMPRTPGINAA